MEINDRYKDFFYESVRATSSKGKKVCVVKDSKLSAFLDTLIQDEEIDEIFRLLYSVIYCSGARISESLSLKKKDFVLEDGFYTAKMKVLKKKKDFDTERYITIDPSINPLLERIFKRLKPQEFIFKNKDGRISRNLCYRCIRKDLGDDLDLHSLRHSNVSLLLNSNLSDLQIAQTLKMSLKMVQNYSHVDEKKTMRELFLRKSS